MALTALETFALYSRFLAGQGFEVSQDLDTLGLTAVRGDASYSIAVVEASGPHLAPAGVVVALAGAVERDVVEWLCRDGVAVVWWNGSIWDGSGTAYAAGLTSA